MGLKFACIVLNRLAPHRPPQLKNTKALNKGLKQGAHKSVLLENGVQCLVWRDKKTGAFINTISNPNSEAQVSRRNKDGSRSQIPCTQSVKLYNTYMGGVDLFDSRRKSYFCSRKSKKCWLRLFYFLLDTTVVNSHILYKETCITRVLTLKEFVVALAENMMAAFSLQKRRSFTTEAPSASRLCERHFPEQIPELKQCRVCPQRKRTTYFCSDCSSDNPIPLCLTKCFKAYHTMPFLRF